MAPPDWPAIQAAKAAALSARIVASGLDAVVVQDQHAARWLTGYSPFMRICPPTGHVAVMRAGGPVHLFPIPYYVGDARRRAPWLIVHEVPAGADALAAAVLELAGPGPVGLCGVTWELGAALAARAPVASAAAEVAAPRAAKVPGEAGLVERALALAAEGMAAARDAAAAGVAEIEVAAAAEDAIRRLGGDGHAIVARGVNAAGLTELAGPDRLRPGDGVLVDVGCYLDGYRGEFARTFAVGDPPAALVDAHRAAVRAIEAAEVMLAPGVTGDALDRAARDALAADGYGSWVLPHPVGHGLGASGGERPAIATGSDDRVPDGAVVNLEPGVFDPGAGLAVRVEDTYLVQAQGARRMTTFPRELAVCG